MKKAKNKTDNMVTFYFSPSDILFSVKPYYLSLMYIPRREDILLRERSKYFYINDEKMK